MGEELRAIRGNASVERATSADADDDAHGQEGAQPDERSHLTDATTPQSGPRARARAGAPISAGRRAGLPDRADQRPQDREALALAHRVVDLATDKKASDIVLLDVSQLTTLTDYFVICSGGSERQLGSIADGIVEGIKADGVRPIGREGSPTAHWVLVDLGSVIVHVMAGPERDFYGLEKLWADATLLLRVQ